MAENPTDPISDGIELSEETLDQPLEVEGRVSSTVGVEASQAAPSFDGTSIDLGLDLLSEPTRVTARPTPSPSEPVPIPQAKGVESTALAPPELSSVEPGGSTDQSPAFVFPEVIDRDHLREALDVAWQNLRGGKLSEARLQFRRIASQIPESTEAFNGLREIQELEIQDLLREGLFNQAVQESSEEKPSAELDSEQLFVPQAKKEASELHSREMAQWKQEQDRLHALDRLESWLSQGTNPESELEREGPSLEEQLLSRMEAESGNIDLRTRLDLGVALFELGLFTAVEPWMRPLLSTEESVRIDAGALCAEAALAEGRAWDAALVLEPLILNPDISPVDKLSLFYLRALAAFKLGKDREALRYLQEVCSLDSEYRDAADRMRILRGRLEIQEEERQEKLKKGEIREELP